MRPHRNLLAWKESILFVKEVYFLAGLLPKEENFGLISQLRRAVLSVPVNLAEGAAGQSDKEFIRFLFISEGSLSEIDTLLEICKTLKYFSEDQLRTYFDKNEHLSALIKGLRKKIETKIITQDK